MVNMQMIPCTSTKQEDNSDLHSIKLEPEQASKVPFPPGCPVVVLNKSRILFSGEVNAVYISFAHNTGSCDNCFEVAYTNIGGEKSTLVVRGGQLRYGIDCPINISPPSGSTFNENEVIEGVIKGFELQPDNISSGDNGLDGSAPFLYTVEVSAAVSDNQEGLYRQRGIGPEHIRFRPLQKAPYLNHETKSSIVSFDDASALSAKEEPRNNTCDDRKTHIETTLVSSVESSSRSPRFTAVPNNTHNGSLHHQHTEQSGTYQEQKSSSPMKCYPIPSPIPNHFQGDISKFKNEKVPEFTFLVNFPLCNKTGSLPPGKRCCVMCGELRWASPSNRNKGKNSLGDKVFIPNQNKGLCTSCDVNIWVVNETKLQIKWCKGCKNFQTWAAFGEKGSATKCMRCRDRQREKYALSKKVDKISTGVKRKASPIDEAVDEVKKRTTII